MLCVPWQWRTVLRKYLAAALLIAGMLSPGIASAAAPAQKFAYTIHHSRYGRIGSYTNTVTRSGDDTTVSTEIKIAVSILGVTLFRQDASRQERWSGGRLINFHGVTTTNGRPIQLDGAAQGDQFVMKTPEGEAIAPADVRLANPWSTAILAGKAMFTPDRGRLDEVQVKGGETVMLPLGRKQVRAKKYDVLLLDGRKKYEVDIDDQGTTVQFVLFNIDGSSVSFSMDR